MVIKKKATYIELSQDEVNKGKSLDLEKKKQKTYLVFSFVKLKLKIVT